MKIVRVETVIVDIPTIRPHIMSVATLASQAIVLVTLTCSDGVRGVGEASTIGGLSYGEESPEGIQQAIETYIAPLMLAGETGANAKLMHDIRTRIVGNHFAKSAVEMALLDAEGKRRNMPLSELLGGRVRDSVPVLWALASGVVETDIEEAEAMLELHRHNCFKLKIGKRTLRDDVEHAKRIKQTLGDRASLRVDVNQAWTLTQAMRGVEMLSDIGVDLVEQPLHRYDRTGMRDLCARSPIPIMADEALRGPYDAYDLAIRNCAHVFSVKVAQSGGLTKAREVVAVADAANVEIYGGTMLEGGVGTIASAHLFSTISKITWGTELFGSLLLKEEMLKEPLCYQNCALKIPTGPGLGVELDEEKIKYYRRKP